MAKLGLSAPWYIYYKKIEALFHYDSTVKVIFDEDEMILMLYVDDSAKASALMMLLPEEKVFGTTKMKIQIIPANPSSNTDCKVRGIAVSPYDVIFERAFWQNPILSYVRDVSGIFANDLIYVVFIKEVVQYYTDDLGDINGLASTLYQEIAKDVFSDCGLENVFFCTDANERPSYMFDTTLGEWP